jgi:hypothetical protein
MKTSLTSVCLLLGLSLSLVPTIATAESTDTFGNNGDSRDAFSRAATGDTSGLLNLINQVQQNKTNPNYSNQQREQVKSATEDFRALQLQVLRDRQKKSAPAPTVQP